MPDTNNSYGAGSDPIARDAAITTTTTTYTDESATPEIAETRAQIEETRAHMADTVDAIREKLSPQHLVEEAKDAAVSAASDAVHGVVDKAKEFAGNAMDVVSSAAGTVMATAADAVDSVKDALHIGGESDETSLTGSPDYAAPYYTATPGAATGTVVPPPRSASEIYSSEPGYPRRIMDATGAAVAPYLSTGLTTGAKIVDTIKLNPLPAALIGIGLGWLLMSAKRQSTTNSGYATATYTDDAYQAPSTAAVYTEQAKQALGNATDAVSGFASDAKDKASDLAGQAKYTVTDFAGQAKDTVSDFAGQAKDKASDIAGQAKDKASDIAGQAKDKASDLAAQASGIASQAKDKASDLADQAKSRASDLASGVKDKASDVVGTVGLKANQLGTAAKSQGQYAASTVDSFVHENPLAAGAIALAVGVAVGLALPSTSKENELIGPTRDRLVDQAGAQASEMVGKVQHVAEAALGVAQDNLGKAKNDLTSSLSDTLQQTKDAFGAAKDQVTDAVKTEAQNQGLAQKADEPAA